MEECRVMPNTASRYAIKRIQFFSFKYHLKNKTKVYLINATQILAIPRNATANFQTLKNATWRFSKFAKFAVAFFKVWKLQWCFSESLEFEWHLSN